MDFLKYSDEELEQMLDDINFILTNRKETAIKQAMLKVSQALEELCELTNEVCFLDTFSGDKIKIYELKELHDPQFNVGIKMDFSTLMR